MCAYIECKGKIIWRRQIKLKKLKKFFGRMTAPENPKKRLISQNILPGYTAQIFTGYM
jgi:hypothetical protein